jgi:hypothetical protein
MPEFPRGSSWAVVFAGLTCRVARHRPSSQKSQGLGALQREASAVHNLAVLHFDRHVESGTPLCICRTNGVRHLVGKVAAMPERLNPQARGVKLMIFGPFGRFFELPRASINTTAVFACLGRCFLGSDQSRADPAS